MLCTYLLDHNNFTYLTSSSLSSSWNTRSNKSRVISLQNGGHFLRREKGKDWNPLVDGRCYGWRRVKNADRPLPIAMATRERRRYRVRRSFVCHFLAATRGNKGRGTKHETKSNPAATGEQARKASRGWRRLVGWWGRAWLFVACLWEQRDEAMGADHTACIGGSRGKESEIPGITCSEESISSSFLFHFRGKLADRRNILWRILATIEAISRSHRFPRDWGNVAECAFSWSRKTLIDFLSKYKTSRRSWHLDHRRDLETFPHTDIFLVSFPTDLLPFVSSRGYESASYPNYFFFFFFTSFSFFLSFFLCVYILRVYRFAGFAWTVSKVFSRTSNLTVTIALYYNRWRSATEARQWR